LASDRARIQAGTNPGGQQLTNVQSARWNKAFCSNAEYEYMNYLLVVQDFVRIPKFNNHYSMAQIRETHEAAEKVTRPSNGWNKSLQALKAEHASRKARQGT
jgi:hypothetical protein